MAIQRAKISRAATPEALAALGPKADYDHLKPPKKSPVRVIFIVLLIITIIGAAGFGGWYYVWTNHIGFDYELKTVVVLEGQSVTADDFLTPGEIERGMKARFADPEFTPVTGPMAVSLKLELGLRSVEANGTLYVLTPESEFVHEFREEAPDLTPTDLITNSHIARGSSFELVFVEQPLPLSSYEVGEYTLRLQLNGVPFEVTLIVQDTTLPVASPEIIVAQIGDELTPLDFVSDVYDHSGIASIVFIGDNAGIDILTASRDEIVEVEITDGAGNSQIYSSSLTVLRNTIPPVFAGLPIAIESMIDKPVAYPPEITAVDDLGREIEFTIIDDEVDTATAGVYTVTFIAEDFTGLITEAQVPVYIITVDIDAVNDWIDEKLASVLTDDMSQEEKVRAVWNAVRNSVNSASDLSYLEWNGSVYTAAGYAINNARGNHVHISCLSELMLTRAEIMNVRIERSEYAVSKSNKTHSWNLVYIDGEGWYHFDATRISYDDELNEGLYLFTQKRADELDDKMAESSSYGVTGYYDYMENMYPDVIRE